MSRGAQGGARAAQPGATHDADIWVAGAVTRTAGHEATSRETCASVPAAAGPAAHAGHWGAGKVRAGCR